MIYFDNAATSYPKPPQMLKGMKFFIEKIGSNPGRSGHRLSLAGGRIINQTRENLAQLFNISDPLKIAFTHNATHALNFALSGILEPGDHVITSNIEHNSIARPLRYLTERGIEFSQVKVDEKTSQLNPEDIKKKFKKNTKMIALIHGSNVTGIIFPIREIGKIARENGVYFLVDASQTAGAYPIDVEEDKIDLLAFTGHKALLGPQGTGGLYVRPGISLKPIIFGGTGSHSEEDRQPLFMPDVLESGTANTVGLAGLKESVKFILKTGVEKIRNHEKKLTQRLIDGLKEIKEVILYGSDNLEEHLPVVSFNIKGFSPSEVGEILDKKYQIYVRVGLHCAPWAHQAIGTYPEGTVRFSLGYYNTAKEVDFALTAIEKIAGKS